MKLNAARAALALLVVVIVALGCAGAPPASSSPAPSASVAVSGLPGPTSTPAATARPTPPQTDPDSGLPWIALGDLPAEARTTLSLIEEGGPFQFDRDGIVFRNRERLLPRQPRGYYREYTVVTPGSDDRGPRRIVAGEDGERYYTDDHYDSFARIQVP